MDGWMGIVWEQSDPISLGLISTSDLKRSLASSKLDLICHVSLLLILFREFRFPFLSDILLVPIPEILAVCLEFELFPVFSVEISGLLRDQCTVNLTTCFFFTIL